MVRGKKKENGGEAPKPASRTRTRSQTDKGAAGKKKKTQAKPKPRGRAAPKTRNSRKEDKGIEKNTKQAEQGAEGDKRIQQEEEARPQQIEPEHQEEDDLREEREVIPQWDEISEAEREVDQDMAEDMEGYFGESEIRKDDSGEEDPDAILEIQVDKTFDDPHWTEPMPPADKIWQSMSGIDVPTINTDGELHPLQVLQFVYDMACYRDVDKAVRDLVMKKAFQGVEGQKWCRKFNFDFDKMMNKLLNTMMWNKEWPDLKAKWEKGEALADDYDNHMHYFKLIAKYAGMKAESRMLKKILMRSMGPAVISAAEATDSKGKFRDFRTLVRLAETGKAHFGTKSEGNREFATSDGYVACLDKRPKGQTEMEPILRKRIEDEEDLVAAAFGRTVKGPVNERKQQRNSGRPICFICGKEGHLARNCWKKQDIRKRVDRNIVDQRSSRRGDIGCAVGGASIRKTCLVGGEEAEAILDSGSSLNIITSDMARRVHGTRVSVDKEIHTVGNALKIVSAIQTTIKISDIEDEILLYVVDEAPADVLLGTPFLERYSEGYKKMMEEFEKKLNRRTRRAIAAVCISINKRLEAILNKYPKLVLGENELPDPKRFYRKRTFRLGLKPEMRDKIYFKAQYPPKPGDVFRYKRLLGPMIGVEFEETDSPHNNPTMIFEKKEANKDRMVIDFRLVNADCAPVGSMAAAPLSIIRMMVGARVFTTVDCKNAFYSLVLDIRDRPYTAISPPGLPRLQLTRMPMGAKASMAALYQAMVDTMGEALYVYVVIWADDIIIFSKTMEEHIRHVDDVLRRLDRNGFCISRKKIMLGQKEVKWLGYTISAEGIRPDMDKVKKLQEMRKPETLKELRSALGMWTYFASFIPDYSIIAAPLMAQLKKENTSLKWTPECEHAWNEVKCKLASPPIMAFPDYKQPFFLHTDACKNGYAAIMTQERDGHHVLIDAISRTTSPAEKNYSSAKLECAAVIWAAKRWKHYLYAAVHTIIVTDSYGLQYLQQKGCESALVQRWIWEMEGFRFSVKYRKGTRNIADFLSRQSDSVAMVSTRSETGKLEIDYDEMDKALKGKRRPREEGEQPGSHEAKRVEHVNRLPQVDKENIERVMRPLEIKEIARRQKEDRNIQRLWKIARGLEVYQATRQEEQDAENLMMIKGVIVKNVPRVDGESYVRVVVPLSLQKRITQMIHEESHAGVKGTYSVLQLYHWFRGMKEVVKSVVRHCRICLASRGRPLTKEKLHPDQRPVTLGGRWHIDGLQLPPSKGYDHLMVAVDVATKYVVLRPARGETGDAAAGILMDITRRFGRPREVTTDRGRAFMCELFMRVCQRLMIRFKPIGVGQPQADGMVERVNRTLIHVASVICKGDGTKWAQMIGEIEYAMNTRISSVTGHSPYELVFGRRPPGPTYTDDIREGSVEGGEGEQLHTLTRRIDVLQQLAHENQMKAAKEQVSYHDAHAQAHTFKLGDKVWLYKASSVEKGVTSKLAYKWKGPYIIVRVIGPVTYIIMGMDGRILPGTVHARQLYKEPEEEQK